MKFGVTGMLILRRFLIRGFILLIICITVKTLIKGYRNYAGYCAYTNKILDDDEKVDLTIAHLLIRYPKSEERLDQYLYPSFSGITKPTASNNRPILYKDIHDFKNLNKKCCYVSNQPDDPEFPPADPLDRIAGTKSSFIKIKFLLRYKAEDAYHEKQIESTYAITNCGIVWNGY